MTVGFWKFLPGNRKKANCLKIQNQNPIWLRLQSYPPLFLKIVVFLFFFSTAPGFAYERIISLKPTLTELIFALGEGGKVVGVTTFCDTPPEVKKIDRVADYLSPDLEKVIAKNPDLILTSKENSSRREIDFLMNRGYHVLYYETGSLEEFLKTLLELGKELGKPQKANELAQEFKRKMEGLRSNTQVQSTQKALFVVGHHPLVVAGSQNLFNEVAPDLRLINLAGDSRLKYPTYSQEMLITKAPELILDFSMGTEASEVSRKSILAEYARLDTIPAIKNKRVFSVDMQSMRASLRLPDELGKIFERIRLSSFK